MTEATRRQGQFRGWSEKARDKKLFELAVIIQQSYPRAFFTSLDVGDFNRLIKPYAPHPVNRPYSLGYFGLILGIGKMFADEKDAKIRLVFDRQDGMSSRIEPIFDSMFSAALPLRERFVGPPQFEDDKMVLPLQAADMLVWLLRRKAERPEEERYVALRNLAVPDGTLLTRVEKEHMERFSRAFSSMPNLQEIGRKEWGRLSATYARDWRLFAG